LSAKSGSFQARVPRTPGISMRQPVPARQWHHGAIHREAYDLGRRKQQKAAPKGGFLKTQTLLALKVWLRGQDLNL
jgi:hypothetical protein